MRDNAKGGALTEVTFFILLSLYTPKHGYAVMQFIEDSTKGRLTLGAGTLYGALNSLQEKGWIAPFGDSAGRKKECHLCERTAFRIVSHNTRLLITVTVINISLTVINSYGNIGIRRSKKKRKIYQSNL